MGLINLSEHLVQLAGTGVMAMGIMNWIGETDSGDMEDSAADDDLFGDDAGGDDFGGMDGGMDDDLDDWGDDGFSEMGGGGGGGAAMQEFEGRIDEMESEVAQLSSAMNTIRSENEEIATSMEEVEENVRKLLEIYEMVTRGVNPFVDDVQADVGGESSFGLFDATAEEESADDDVDDEVMDAEAESFFDDDAFDEFEEEDDGEDFEAEFADESDEGEDEPSSGTTFQDLKAEYESGEADWAENDGDDPSDAEIEIEAPAGDAEASDEGVGMEFELADEEDADEFEYTEAVDPDAESGDEGRRKPYLAALPNGYVVDLVVLEWLDYMVSEFEARNAVRAVQYYEQIHWISEPVKEDLMSFLEGFAAVDEDADAAGPVEMDVDDHIRSLTFISKLTGDSLDGRIDRRLPTRGEDRGLQC